MEPSSCNAGGNIIDRFAQAFCIFPACFLQGPEGEGGQRGKFSVGPISLFMLAPFQPFYTAIHIDIVCYEKGQA